MALYGSLLGNKDDFDDILSEDSDLLPKANPTVRLEGPSFFDRLKRIFGIGKGRRAAFIMLLFCAQYSDRARCQEEDERLATMKARLNASKFTDDDWAVFEQAQNKYLNAKTDKKRIRLYGKLFRRALVKFKRSSNAKEKRALFIHALDLIWADKFIRHGEKRYLKQLAEGLGIEESDEEFVRDAIEVMQYKNNF